MSILMLKRFSVGVPPVSISTAYTPAGGYGIRPYGLPIPLHSACGQLRRGGGTPPYILPEKGNVGRPALWPPCPLPATANLPCNPHTLTPQTKASLVKGRPDCRKIASLPYCVCRGDHWSPVSLPPQRNFRDSFHTRQTGTGEQCSPLQERFDTLLQP